MSLLNMLKAWNVKPGFISIHGLCSVNPLLQSSVEEEQPRTPVLGVDECAKRASFSTARQAWLGYMSLQMSKREHTEISEVAQGHAAANAELKLESAFLISSPVPFPLYTIS